MKRGIFLYLILLLGWFVPTLSASLPQSSRPLVEVSGRDELRNAAAPAVSEALAPLHSYDGDGNRVSKTVGGVTTKFLVDDQNQTGYAQVVEEIQGGVVNRIYTYGHDLVSQRQNILGTWVTHFYGYDGHGSVRYLTDINGNMADSWDYDAFGIVLSSAGSTPNAYLYAGEQFDANLGLYYLRARYMEPAVGRFWTMDTFEGRQGEPKSLHKYLYADSDPINRIDPSGHFSISEVNAVMSQIGTLGRFSIQTFGTIQRARSIMDVAYSVEGLVSALNGSLGAQVKDAIRNSRSVFKELDADEALESLSENYKRILSSAYGHWGRELAIHGKDIQRFLIYMPVPVPGPEIEVPTGVRLPGISKPVALVFGAGGTKWGRVVGMGIDFGAGIGRKQIWRMDYHPFHSKGETFAKENELSVWRDGSFHYHVSRFK